MPNDTERIPKGQLLELESALRDIVATCDNSELEDKTKLEIVRYTAKAALLET